MKSVVRGGQLIYECGATHGVFCVIISRLGRFVYNAEKDPKAGMGICLCIEVGSFHAAGRLAVLVV